MTAGATTVRNPPPRTMPGRGNWWLQPTAIAVGFSAFVIYSFWSVVIGSGGHAWTQGPYLSPFYSPVIKLGWWPLSSAILVAWVPLGFRATCYYYRKAYYRAFFWDPAACAIREPQHRQYAGERRFPFILNNFHRFFLYLAVVVLAFLWFDTISAFHYKNGIYIGAGSVLMLINVVLLSFYTGSCHALRHLVGGNIDCYSCALGGNARHGTWLAVSKINPYHGAFAWFSLVSVAVVDIYIRLVAGGVFGTSCFGVHTGC